MQNVDISVNVLGVDDDRDIISIRTSKFCSQRKHHVNLLMLIDQNKFHYVSVQTLSRLVNSWIKYNGKKYLCHYCLHPFNRLDYPDMWTKTRVYDDEILLIIFSSKSVDWTFFSSMVVYIYICTYMNINVYIVSLYITYSIIIVCYMNRTDYYYYSIYVLLLCCVTFERRIKKYLYVCCDSHHHRWHKMLLLLIQYYYYYLVSVSLRSYVRTDKNISW